MTFDVTIAAQHFSNNPRTIELFTGILIPKIVIISYRCYFCLSLSLPLSFSFFASSFFGVVDCFRGETDESIGTIADTRMNHQYPQTCFGSSEYELALILKELRWITDQVKIELLKLPKLSSAFDKLFKICKYIYIFSSFRPILA